MCTSFPEMQLPQKSSSLRLNAENEVRYTFASEKHILQHLRAGTADGVFCLSDQGARERKAELVS